LIYQLSLTTRCSTLTNSGLTLLFVPGQPHLWICH
jgi:hypothetical protein